MSTQLRSFFFHYTSYSQKLILDSHVEKGKINPLNLSYFLLKSIRNVSITEAVTTIMKGVTTSRTLLIITAVLTQISMALKVVVYLSERRDNQKYITA